MSCCRKHSQRQSDRQEYVYLETHFTVRVWVISGEGNPEMAWLIFMGQVISQANE